MKDKDYNRVQETYTKDLTNFAEKAIKSLCLTDELRRWLPMPTTVFFAEDETTWEEGGAGSRRRTIERGPPLLEVEKTHPWRHQMPSVGIEDQWPSKVHCGTA
jgi:hypothetical protein